jgi:hypothetical protein
LVPSSTFIFLTTDLHRRRFLDLETLVPNILILRMVILMLLNGNDLGMELNGARVN